MATKKRTNRPKPTSVSVPQDTDEGLQDRLDTHDWDEETQTCNKCGIEYLACIHLGGVPCKG